MLEAFGKMDKRCLCTKAYWDNQTELDCMRENKSCFQYSKAMKNFDNS